MSNAAQAIAEEALRRFRPKHVLVACGPGNNGGDGLAAASLLSREAEVRVVLAADAGELKTPEARWAYRRLDKNRVAVEPYRGRQRFRELTRKSDLIIDALLGSGATGELREPIRSMVLGINASRRPVLSVDVPTGFEGRPAVRPTVTLALHDKKAGMTRTNSGTIVVRDIGIPARAADEVGPGDFTQTYRENAPGSHKGQNGRLLIVAGGPYTGAPILCAMAAARSGVDLVRLYTPSDGAMAAQAALPDLIVHPGLEPRRLVEEDVLRIRTLLPRVDALLVGPGLGEAPATRKAVERLLGEAARARASTILDADALAVAGHKPALLRRLKPLATPHHGEFRELTGHAVPRDVDAAKRTVQSHARRLRSVLLVKGPVDLISNGHRTKANRVHHPAMTTGGTGDVLAGLAAGLVAKGLDPFRAACAAAFVNGEAGQRVAARQGGTLVASDLVRELPRVFRRWLIRR